MAMNINKIIEESMRGPRAQEALTRFNNVTGLVGALRCILHSGTIPLFPVFACRYCSAKQRDNPYWMCYFLDEQLCGAESHLAKQFKCACPIHPPRRDPAVQPTKDDVEIYMDGFGKWQCRFKPIAEGVDRDVVASIPDLITRLPWIAEGYYPAGHGIMMARPPTHAMIPMNDLRKIIREEMDKINKEKTMKRPASPPPPPVHNEPRERNWGKD